MEKFNEKRGWIFVKIKMSDAKQWRTRYDSRHMNINDTKKLCFNLILKMSKIFPSCPIFLLVCCKWILGIYNASFRQCWRFSKEWRFQEKFRHAIVRKLKSNRKRNRSARRIASDGLISSQDASKARYKLRYTLIEQYRG